MSKDEEPDMCAMCYLSWCKSPKTWCRFLCFLTTLTHGVVYAVLSCLLILDLKPSSYFPLLKVVQEEIFPTGGPMTETYVSCLLIILNFLLALPYLVVAASGSRNTGLLFATFIVCTLELLQWLGLLILAVVSISYVTSDLRIIFQWIVLAAMISLLFMCWTLLLMTWKRRRHEQIVAVHTARLISNRKKRKGKQEPILVEAGL